MKKKNFPNRKQRRRKSAYERLLKNWKKDTMSLTAKDESDSLDKSLAKGDLRGQRSKKSRA